MKIQASDWNIDGANDVAFTMELSSMAEPIPEPATIALLGIGLAGLAGVAMRRKLKKVKNGEQK